MFSIKRSSIYLNGLIFMLASIHATAQNSGSGSISNYQINCMAGANCVDASNPFDSLIITAPEDGELKITVTLMNGSVVCCTPPTPYDLSIEAKIYTVNNPTPLWIFVNNNTSSYTIQCVEENDQFLLVFGGSKGDYNYMTESFPSDRDNDLEPNDISSQATFLSPEAAHEGRIGYGVYTRDQNDWYEVVADKNGRLKVDIDTDAGANFFIKNHVNLTVIATKLMPNAGMDSLIVSCVAPNDTFYLQVVARSNICADYTLYYQTIVVDGTEDAEPNNMISEATEIAADTDNEGMIGFRYYGTDLADYYKLTSDTSGNLEIRLEFDDMINVRLYRFNNQSQILFKLALTGGKDTLRVLCVAEGDMFFLKIEKDIPKCTAYSVNYTTVDPPEHPSDVEDNNTIGTATEVLNIPGNFTGNLDYGFYTTDQID
ncbi:MAG: hypothetical protein IPL46_18860 [Saprospiraceae bacterium]|nr:hypothetical protein [Saprospiraceae bacterium]